MIKNLTKFYLATADGTPNGINNLEGGVCEMFNMRIKLAVSEAYGKDYHFFERLNPNPNLSLTEMNQKMTLLFQIDLEILTIQPKNIPEPDE